MVLKSIGYKSVPVDGLPFDHQKGKTKDWIHQIGMFYSFSFSLIASNICVGNTSDFLCPWAAYLLDE